MVALAKRTKGKSLTTFSVAVNGIANFFLGSRFLVLGS